MNSSRIINTCVDILFAYSHRVVKEVARSARDLVGGLSVRSRSMMLASIPLVFLVRMGMRRLGVWGRGENSLVEETTAAAILDEVLNGDPEEYEDACRAPCGHAECIRYRRRVDEVALNDFGATHFDDAPPGAVLPLPAGPLVDHGQAMLPMVEVAEVPVPMLGINVRTRNGRACNHPDRYRLNANRRNGFRRLLYDTLKAQFPCVVNGKYKPFSDTDIAAIHKSCVTLQKTHGVRPNHIPENTHIVVALLSSPSPEERLGMTIYRSRSVQLPVYRASAAPKVHGPLWNLLGTNWLAPSWAGRQTN